MKGKLDEWFHKYVNSEVDGVREEVYGKGQLNLPGVKEREKKHLLMTGFI